MSDPPLSTLVRGYPPVLGAMLLVDGVLTVILGGDATVSLGEVVAYLLLPPLAMFLLTKLTGGRRPDAVTIGAGVAGAAVILAALFLGGGVHLLTLPGWVLALVGLLLLGVAVVLMRRSAPAPAVPSLLSPTERDGFTQRDHDDVLGQGGYDQPAEPERPTHRERMSTPPGWGDSDEARAGFPAGDRQTRPDGPTDREWPPAASAEREWPSGSAEPEWPPAASPEREWPPVSADRQWPSASAGNEWPAASGGDERPASVVPEWPPRRDPEPASDTDASRSWFEFDEPTTRSSDSSERERPPSGGRRSRRSDQ